MNAWSYLPNAHHIDRVLESVKSYSEMWVMDWDVSKDNAIYNASTVTLVTTWNSSRHAIIAVAWKAVWGVYRNRPRDDSKWLITGPAWDTVRRTVWNATEALITYDDASKYLEMPSDKLRVWALLSEDPAAVLLLPAVVAFERINELECEL
jgi:hypothetical protein